MPRFERTADASGPLVRGYADGQFVVGEERFAGLLLTPERALAWEAPPLADLDAAHMDEALALRPPPEFLLLGSGPSLRRPPASFTAALEARGIGVEVMDSRAAARAWSVLRTEERWIVAALMPLV